MYNNLESRIFNSYLLQSDPELSICNESSLSKDAWQSLYNWTRNTYCFFSKHPESIMKVIHEDDAYPWGMRSLEKPKLKPDMRKSLKAMNSLLKSVWDFVLSGNIQNNTIKISDDVKITAQNIKLLEYTGIVLKERSLYTENYPGMFLAIHDLIMYPDGFKRFVRCSYNENSEAMISVYKQFADNDLAFIRLVNWLRENNYKYTVTLDNSEVQDFESSRISFMKNITGNNTTIFPGYDHEHIGFLAYFDALKIQPGGFRLFIQRVRDVIADFDNLNPVIQKFIMNNHARCNNCGYCTQRSKGKQKPYTIYARFEDHNHALCPINYVYTYCWTQIDDELVECIIAFLTYFEEKFL